MDFLNQCSQLHEVCSTIIPPLRWRRQGSVGLSGLSKVPLLIWREDTSPTQRGNWCPLLLKFHCPIILHLKDEKGATPYSVWSLCTAHGKPVSTESSAGSTIPLVTFMKKGHCYLHTKDTNWMDLEAPLTLRLESRMWNPSSAVCRILFLLPFFGTLKLWTS